MPFDRWLSWVWLFSLRPCEKIRAFGSVDGCCVPVLLLGFKESLRFLVMEGGRQGYSCLACDAALPLFWLGRLSLLYFLRLGICVFSACSAMLYVTFCSVFFTAFPSARFELIECLHGKRDFMNLLEQSSSFSSAFGWKLGSVFVLIKKLLYILSYYFKLYFLYAWNIEIIVLAFEVI